MKRAPELLNVQQAKGISHLYLPYACYKAALRGPFAPHENRGSHDEYVKCVCLPRPHVNGTAHGMPGRQRRAAFCSLLGPSRRHRGQLGPAPGKRTWQ